MGPDKNEAIKEKPVKSIQKTLQEDLVTAVKAGNFKKASRLRESLKNIK